MKPPGIVLAERYMKFCSLDEAQRNPGSPIGGIPRIPVFGLHPGYTCYMEIAIHGT